MTRIETAGRAEPCALRFVDNGERLLLAIMVILLASGVNAGFVVPNFAKADPAAPNDLAAHRARKP